MALTGAERQRRFRLRLQQAADRRQEELQAALREAETLRQAVAALQHEVEALRGEVEMLREQNAGLASGLRIARQRQAAKTPAMPRRAQERKAPAKRDPLAQYLWSTPRK